MDDLLIEIGCEELPAGSVNALASFLADSLRQTLMEAELLAADASAPAVFATPRRLAVRWPQVAARQDDREVERRGPSKAAGFKDGEPSKALAGFLKSAGATLADVSTLETPKGEWLVVRQTQAGRTLAEVVSAAMPDILKQMPMPRRMRWGTGLHEFLRPVNWLLALHGDAVLPLSLFGLSADRVTFGHRFHAPDAISLPSAAGYESMLLSAYVVADAQLRRERIVSGVQREADALGGTPVMDEALVDEVTVLVEWPVVLSGRFDARFLEIPKEALIQTMQENQRYFALLDNQQALMPAFITVANIESVNPRTVIDGNERVIRPRFDDTMFFWEQDKNHTLASHRPALGAVLFQERLGSVGDKVDRLQKLCDWLAPQTGADPAASSEAALLGKCDLVTGIVEELPKMQGIAGRYYAARDGHSDAVASAVEEHYWPRQAGGDLPTHAIGDTLAIADRADTLVGIFGAGLVPTGNKDPFALRRASLGIVRLLVEKQHDVDLLELIDASIALFGDRLDQVDRQAVLDYVLERLRGYLQEQGYARDAVDAVLAKGLSRPLDIVARLQAIAGFRETEAAVSLSAASKRIGNMLKKSGVEVASDVDSAQLPEPAEQALFAELVAIEPGINQQVSQRDYAAAMTATARLREPVDAFFDEVMVMSDDQRLRDNRLALLARVDRLCCATAELSQLRPGGA